MSTWMILVAFPILLALLGVAAARWGVDSRDPEYSLRDVTTARPVRRRQ